MRLFEHYLLSGEGANPHLLHKFNTVRGGIRPPSWQQRSLYSDARKCRRHL